MLHRTPLAARLLTSLLVAAVPAAAQSVPSHWIRSFDWVEEPWTSQGTTTGNPAQDPAGNLVWSYGYTSGGASGSSNPWYLEPVTPMTWDPFWHNSGQGVWSRSDDGGAHTRWSSLTHWLWTAGIGHFDSIPVVSFVNATSTSFTVDLVGTAHLWWSGIPGAAATVDADLVIATRDGQTGAVTPLLLETHAKPNPGSQVESKALAIDLTAIQLDPGDEIFWTLRGTSSTTTSRWVALVDGFSVVRQRVGASYCAPGNQNSLGTTARLVGVGSDRAADNDLMLVAFDVPIHSFGYFLTSRSQGFVAQPGGSQGNLCLSGTIGRFVGPGQVQQAGGEQIVRMALDLTQHPTPHLGLIQVVAGETWNFQYWHRDVGGTSNLSTALQVAFQ